MKLKKRKYTPLTLAIVLLACAVGASCILLHNAPAQQSETPQNAQAVNVNNTLSNEKVTPKHGTYLQHEGEMMAVWVPFMSLSVEDEGTKEAFEKKFDEIVKTSKEHNMNTLIVHVRPYGDALYPSEYYPWSHILTGTQGKDPGYDPLEYMIDTAHAAGLEFHAWINPLRMKVSQTPQKLSADNPHNLWKNDDDKTNDDWTLSWDGDIYLNPASAGARRYIIDSIEELIRNYAVDGIHFDDYFYPTSDAEYDKASYQAYRESLDENATPLTLTAWRTANISSLIAGVYNRIHALTDQVVFGVSPQGNIENDLGMGADVYDWGSIQGYVDYLCPQIYVSFDHALLPYDQTAQQWRELTSNSNVKLYIGLAVYKAGSDADEGTWEGSNDILKQQIEYGRNLGADGFMLYAYDYLVNNQTKEEIENVMKVI